MIDGVLCVVGCRPLMWLSLITDNQHHRRLVSCSHPSVSHLGGSTDTWRSFGLFSRLEDELLHCCARGRFLRRNRHTHSENKTTEQIRKLRGGLFCEVGGASRQDTGHLQIDGPLSGSLYLFLSRRTA